ncbi:MAG: hypothetical protein K940chlam7_00591 [Chlamydiae bacterium]|nr:hypothetical protein [Chlamydiota bacterium]
MVSDTTTTCGCGFSECFQNTWNKLQTSVTQLLANKNVAYPQTHTLKKSLNKTTVLLQDIRHLEESGYNDDDILQLAKKINGVAGNLIMESLEVLKSPEGQETLFATSQLASALKSLKPLRRQTWQKLSQDVQELFDAITPYTSPPTRNEDKRLTCCSATDLPRGSFYLSFADASLFRAQYYSKKNVAGEIHFTLPDHRGVVLCGTGKFPHIDQIEKYALQEHSKIQDIFDVESLNSQITKFKKYPDISRETTPQWQHQSALLQAEYLNRILQSLGVPVDRPLSIAEKGEWSIFPSGGIYTVFSQTLIETDQEKLKRMAGAIRTFFDLEKMYGLVLMHDATHVRTPSAKDPFLLRDSDHVFTSKLPSKLAFIEGSIEKRHDELKKYLERIYPKAFASEIFRHSTDKSNEEEKIVNFLSLLVKKGFLSFESLLTGSEEALEVLYAIMHPPYLYKNSEEIPWDKLTSLDNLLVYLHLKQYASQNKEKRKTTPEKNIYQDAHPIENIPRLGQTTPADKSLETISREQLKKLMITRLHDEFLKNPKKPLQEILQDLIDKQCEKLSEKAREDSFKLFLGPFIEELNQMIFPEITTGNIIDRITLLRTANIIAEDDNPKKELVTKMLYEVLHPHMKEHEKKRVAGEVLQRVLNYREHL